MKLITGNYYLIELPDGYFSSIIKRTIFIGRLTKKLRDDEYEFDIIGANPDCIVYGREIVTHLDDKMFKLFRLL